MLRHIEEEEEEERTLIVLYCIEALAEHVVCLKRLKTWGVLGRYIC